MIIYCDGSTFEITKPAVIKKYGENVASLSWGIKIEDGNFPIEIMGQRFLPKQYRGAHEIIAFVEAVIWANAHNGNTLNTVFYTDYQKITDMCKPAHTKNKHKLSESVKRQLMWVKDLYTADILNLAEQYMIFAQINWVKGHSGCVNNHRADYLSRSAHKIAIGNVPHALSFEKWLGDYFSCDSGRKSHSSGLIKFGSAFLN